MILTPLGNEPYTNVCSSRMSDTVVVLPATRQTFFLTIHYSIAYKGLASKGVNAYTFVRILP